MNIWPNVISAMLLVPICQKSHPKIPYSYNCEKSIGNIRLGVFCKLLSRPFEKVDMTLGQGQKARDTRKNWQFKVAFRLGKSSSNV